MQTQQHEIDEFRLEADFTINDDNKVMAGVDYRTSSMKQRRLVTAQILGDWGVTQSERHRGPSARVLSRPTA